MCVDYERERVREEGGEREGEVCVCVLSACQKITYTFSYWSLLNFSYTCNSSYALKYD